MGRYRKDQNRVNQKWYACLTSRGNRLAFIGFWNNKKQRKDMKQGLTVLIPFLDVNKIGVEHKYHSRYKRIFKNVKRKK